VGNAMLNIYWIHTFRAGQDKIKISMDGTRAEPPWVGTHHSTTKPATNNTVQHTVRGTKKRKWKSILMVLTNTVAEEQLRSELGDLWATSRGAWYRWKRSWVQAMLLP
jgi:hypothetical protein